MTVQEKAKEIVHSVEHPVEAAKALEREAEVGRSARTPVIALTGVPTTPASTDEQWPAVSTTFGAISVPVQDQAE